MKKKIIYRLFYILIFLGGIGCSINWFNYPYYNERYVFIADSTLEVEDSIYLELKGNVKDLSLITEDTSVHFLDSTTLIIHLVPNSTIDHIGRDGYYRWGDGFKMSQKLSQDYRTEFRYFDDIMRHFDSVILFQKNDTLAVWTPTGEDYKNMFSICNWKYDEYRNASFHANTRTFAYYFSRSDLEELRAIKE